MVKPIRLIATFLLLTTGSFHAIAQFNLGESTGYGGAGLTGQKVWALGHNQAGIAEIESIEVGLAYRMAFMLNETATQSLQVGVPVQGGAFGLSINAFGFELFKERKIGLAYARKMSDKLRVGLQLNYESLAFGDVYGNSYTMTFEGGFQYSLNDQFVLAGHVVNPNKSKYRGAPELAGPSELRGGVRYLFSDNIFVVGEARKNSEEDVRLLFGTEFQVVDFLIVRLGVSTEPTLMSFGLGFNYRAFHFALSSDYHNELGITPTFALRYVRS